MSNAKWLCASCGQVACERAISIALQRTYCAQTRRIYGGQARNAVGRNCDCISKKRGSIAFQLVA
jgi:hypothetical protein